MTAIHRCALGASALAGALLAASCTDATAPTSSLQIRVPSVAWAAYQNDGGPWVRLTPGADCVTIDATQRLTIATVITAAAVPFTDVRFLTRDEAASLYPCGAGDPVVKQLWLQTGGLHVGDYATAAFGFSGISAVSDSLLLVRATQAEPLDLLAARSHNGEARRSAVVLRRAAAPADGDTVRVNFDSSEAFVPDSVSVAFSNIPIGSAAEVQTSLRTATRTLLELGDDEATGGSGQMFVLPQAQRAAGDMYLVNADTYGADLLTMRTYFASVPSQPAMAFGPEPPALTLTPVAATPVRLQLSFASQPEYGEYVSALLVGTRANVELTVTKDYAGSTPATWTMTMPDFTSAAGYLPSWGLDTASPFWVLQASGFPFLYPGDAAVSGQTYRFAVRYSTSFGALRLDARPALRW